MAPIARKRDVDERMTEHILAKLEEGTIPWDQPWDVSFGLPTSMSSSKHYNGVNLFMLMLEQMARGYRSQWWGTFNQIAAKCGGEQVEVRGGRKVWTYPDAPEGASRGVRKGEKGTLVVLFKPTDRTTTNAEGVEVTKRSGFLRGFTVFNADQCEGLPERYTNAPTREHTPIEAAEQLCAAYVSGPEVTFGGDRACYSPSKDKIWLPVPEDFTSPEDYYSTRFHEMTHSTGHASRLKRDGIVENHFFGDELYSKEELIAELGSVFLCAMAGIEKTILDRSAAYIDSWRSKLGQDTKLIRQAAAAAQKAVDLIAGDTASKAEGNDEEADDLVEQAA